MKPVICVTEKEYFKAEDVFENSPEFDCVPISCEEDVLAKAVIDNNALGVILGVENYSGKLYSALPKGGIIARFGVGHDGVDKQKATDNGLIATNTPDVLDDSVAEHSVFLMGSLACNIAFHDANMKSQKWQPSLGSEMKGKTLLVIVCGKIGCKVAKIASMGFGMHVVGFDVSKLDAKQLQQDWGTERIADDLESELGKADFVSLHIPAIEATKHFVNTNFLSKMKTSSYIVNTSRGSVIDENALYESLAEGNIAGAGLDVYETEPYVPKEEDKDLRKLSNVVLTPHVASGTIEACRRMAESSLKNVKAAYKKKYDSLDILNEDVLGKL